MDVLTLFVDQGALAGIRVGGEGIIVDAHMPECEKVNPEEIQQSLSLYFKGIDVRGLILTGFDSDHAHDLGVEWILTNFQPAWIMYPKYYKDTDCATAVFNSINKHERRRAATSRPLIRHSIRLDKMVSRMVGDLGDEFTVELFSPHFEDIDSSNNCSIVAKIVGNGAAGFRYLATGDTEIDRWETISRLFGDNLAADVMAARQHWVGNGGKSHGAKGPSVAIGSTPHQLHEVMPAGTIIRRHTPTTSGRSPAALGHKVGDAVDQAYRRGGALAKRRKLMEAWTRYCEPSLRSQDL